MSGDGARPPADGAGVLVCVPTYNEVDNLPGLLERLHAVLPALRILVVDDGSPDGTGRLADELAAADGRVRVLHHHPRAGLGAAYVDAFRAITATYPADQVGWVVQMDADGSHAPEQLPRLLAAADRADVVLGSRYVPGGAVRDWSWHRYGLSALGNLYSRWAVRLPARDVTGGFRLFRRDVIADIFTATIASQGYCFQVDVVARLRDHGYRVVEVPITFVEREKGSSKMHAGVVTEALWRVTAWGLRTRWPRAMRRLRALRR